MIEVPCKAPKIGGEFLRDAAAAASGKITAPEIGDLTERLHFNPSDGRIWLDDRRMILMHSEAFATLRQEMIESMGLDAARGMLTRVGYIAGSRDAAIAWKVRGGCSQLDLLAAGAQFHALQGIVSVEPIRIEIDSASGYCYGEFIWKHSVEDDVHLIANGVGSEPGCWMEVGYCSGFLTALMGKRILVREVECRSMGNAQCRVIAKPLEAWTDPEVDLRYFESGAAKRSQLFVPRVASSGPASVPTKGSSPQSSIGPIVGASAAFSSVIQKIHRVAPTNATVLLLGESGVGKSIFAREMHAQSLRAKNVLIEVNCAAIPEQLMESELFGVERGAFSGATASRAGRFEIANQGTIFLDEIAMLSLTAQGKLLRILQTGEMERLGSTHTRKVDVRVVAATNENLPKAIKDGRFREDLFYRLNVFPLTVPPLRERKDDIPVMLEFFLDKFCRSHNRHVSGTTPRALRALLSYSWPGNIREFENVIERGIILADEGEPLDLRHLFSVDASFETNRLLGLSDSGALTPKLDLLNNDYDAGDPLRDDHETITNWATSVVKNESASLYDVEQALIKAAIRQSNGNISKAASLLRISRAQMEYRAKKLVV
ncbi:Sigma-54-dependent Fis family transcriptional regulator [Methylocella tundrae]|uniref:Sigma-54-dependent Fis family transcriptional regulator n=1 Tax=Methylocella tundrae TaxID=227605 RepID=A0A8B6M8L7_METTU|nr:sigma-54-dependent Fis family transcriptional regulator [Methylocella tundrae]VTZ21285.1 Sigma-54-dependent Fis family transcriptional regulator [Methylocella tundrae]VTZ51137.1 Sigma-54-dependent Fis family transcriptional regulator [Methylocella tundrae]